MPVIDGPVPGKTKPRHNYNEPSPAALRAMRVADTPATKERFLHETDAANVESIRRKGLRPSRGGGAMGHEGVYAYQGGDPQGRTIPKGRALIEFEADPRRISGRGTTPGSRSVALAGGGISADDILRGYGSEGRLFSGAPGVIDDVLGIATMPRPGGEGSLGDLLFEKMGIPDVQVTPESIRMDPAYEPPRPRGADVGAYGGLMPEGSLMQYALAQSALANHSCGWRGRTQPRRGRTY
jgi:hypothetical protein